MTADDLRAIVERHGRDESVCVDSLNSATKREPTGYGVDAVVLDEQPNP